MTQSATGAAGRLAGKHALVTGAARGIGRATAERFADEGANVIATDIDAEALGELRDRAGVETFELDVTDSEAIAGLAARIDDIDVLFNCAGIVHQGDILACPEDEWARSFDTNVTSIYRMIRVFLPIMLARGGGSIINVASVVSSLKGVPQRCAYGASKAAVIGLTKSVAADYIGRGIRCNALCPGTVDTPSLAVRMAELGDAAEIRRRFEQRQPIGRLGTALEIAAAAAYFASDESEFVTGTTFVIDGGMSL
jgi:2-keto-3-deoxy-L-fuconate dehydrogenase